MFPNEIRIIALRGLPEIAAGDDIAELIARTAAASGIEIKRKDIIVIAHKIVSKAEGRMVHLKDVRPSGIARSWAQECRKDPAVVEVILEQSRRIVRMDQGILIAETQHGFVCANAGVDASNVPVGDVVLLPEDPDRSASQLRLAIEKRLQVPLAVIVSDTFGRPWREGLVNIALGVSGMDPFIDYRGQADLFGRRLEATLIASADELASAAELVMGKTTSTPVAIIRGFDYRMGPGAGRLLIRAADQDLFR
jgi:coenzyme F420-0:L-glutamate ligase/coenzyme F420-1:gamma-L-glutamate ligase